MSKAELDVSGDAAALALRVADWLVGQIADTTGAFALYEILAGEHYRREIEWGRVHLFFGDERFVPRDHKDSNYRMAHEAMIAHVPIPPENVHPVETESSSSPADVAASYERVLKGFYGKATLDLVRPLFAVTLLGLGDDGHTASLFPGTKALMERERWVTSVIGAKPEPRISLTYPALNASGTAAFLVAGAAKHTMLKRVVEKDPALPASQVDPCGRLVIFCDQAAAGDLAGPSSL